MSVLGLWNGVFFLRGALRYEGASEDVVEGAFGVEG